MCLQVDVWLNGKHGSSILPDCQESFVPWIQLYYSRGSALVSPVSIPFLFILSASGQSQKTILYLI